MSQYKTDVVVYSNNDLFDAKASGSSLVVTVDPGIGRFYVSTVFIECTDATGVSVAGIVSIGTNSPNYNNIASGLVIPSNVDRVLINTLDAPIDSLDEGASIYVRRTTPSVATEHLFKVGIEGYHAG